MICFAHLSPLPPEEHKEGGRGIDTDIFTPENTLEGHFYAIFDCREVKARPKSLVSEVKQTKSQWITMAFNRFFKGTSTFLFENMFLEEVLFFISPFLTVLLPK